MLRATCSISCILANHGTCGSGLSVFRCLVVFLSALTRRHVLLQSTLFDRLSTHYYSRLDKLLPDQRKKLRASAAGM